MDVTTADLPGHRRWMIVGSLFFVQFVNFWDKQVVSLAAPALMTEFHMSPGTYGLLAGGFFALYGAGGVIVALVAAPRWRPRIILAALLLVWSLLQMPVVLVASLTTLIMSRMLLGLSEGAGAPTALNVAHEWFDDRSREVPSAIILFGATVGSLVAAPVLTAVILHHGWRSAFIVCGLLGLLLLLLVLLVGRDGPYRAEAKAAGSTGATAPIPTRLLVRDTTLLGNLAIGSCAYCMTGFAVGWLPLYLGSITGNLVQTAWLMSGILAFQALVVLTIPMLSQRLVKHGVRSRFARGWTMASCMMASGASFMAATLIVGVRAKLILVAVAVGLPAAVFPISAASISEVTPAPYRNAAVTIIFAGITIPVIFTSLATGWLVSTAGWNGALASYGVIMLAGAAAGYMLLQPERSLMRLARL